MQFLDVAAGSGALSIPAALIGARVTATDLSPALIERLSARADHRVQSSHGAAALALPGGEPREAAPGVGRSRAEEHPYRVSDLEYGVPVCQAPVGHGDVQQSDRSGNGRETRRGPASRGSLGNRSF